MLVDRGTFLRGDPPLAEYGRTEDISPAREDQSGVARTSADPGPLPFGDPDAALSLYGEAEGIFRRLGDQGRVAQTLTMRADLLSDREDYEAALQGYGEAEDIFRGLGDRHRLALALVSHGVTARRLDDDEAAFSTYREAADIFRELGDREWLEKTLNNCAAIASLRGDSQGRAVFHAERDQALLDMDNEVIERHERDLGGD